MDENCKGKTCGSEIMGREEAWIAKDKHGDLWLGTLGKTKEDVESNFDSRQKRIYKLKIVKVKIMEINDG